jgi:hypothetical protein
VQRREIIAGCTERVALSDGNRERPTGVRRVGIFLAILHINFSPTIMN